MPVRLPILTLSILQITLCLFSCGQVHAGIVSSGGVSFALSPPADVSGGGTPTGDAAILFREKGNIVLPTGLHVNISLPGTSPIDTGKNFSQADIPAGILVDSYFVYANPEPNTGIHRIEGSITFDHDILGVAVNEQTLNPSDLILGLPGTVYPTPPPRTAFEDWSLVLEMVRQREQ